MITLTTLPQASEQEVFDQVATHMLTQHKKCVTSEGSCQYRSNGLMCAAGCLMGDEEYNPEFEGFGWNALSDKGKVPHTHMKLICKLQDIHDSEHVDHWAELLDELAEIFNLNTPDILKEAMA